MPWVGTEREGDTAVRPAEPAASLNVYVKQIPYHTLPSYLVSIVYLKVVSSSDYLASTLLPPTSTTSSSNPSSSTRFFLPLRIHPDRRAPSSCHSMLGIRNCRVRILRPLVLGAPTWNTATQATSGSTSCPITERYLALLPSWPGYLQQLYTCV